MKLGRIWTLRGPNRWAPVPVIEADVNLAECESSASRVEPVLRAALGDAVIRLPESASPADALLAATRGFQQRTGYTGSIAFLRPPDAEGRTRIVFDYDDATVGRACLDSGFELVTAALAGSTFDVPRKLEEIRAAAHEARLGPSTRSIVDAAIRRGIPTCRLNDGSLVQLGWGVKQKRIWTAETDDTPVVAEVIAQDKQLTRKLLAEIGVPAPWGRAVRDEDDAWQAALECELPVVVKPRFGNQGRGVATNLGTREQVIAAYRAARAEGAEVVVETFAPGQDFRVLVVGGRVVAASMREPAHVIGDGTSTIRELVEITNRDPRRSDGHATPLSWIRIDAIALGVLADQGYTADSVPAAGTKVLIRRNANLSTGGTASDVTDEVHPEVAADAVAAARAVGLDIAGIDIVCEDISRPLRPQRGAIVEVNAGPGLRMHLEPSAGQPRDVGSAIVDALFPPRETARIPIVAVTGTNGKTTTTRLISHLLATAGKFVGMTCTDGIYLAGRRTETRDCSGPQSARQVFLNSRVEVAVLETARGGILREGLGFDRCDVAVVANLGKGDHLGLRGVDTLDQLAEVKRVVPAATAPSGTAILNAADPLVAKMAESVRGKVLFFARDEAEPTLATHRSTGGLVAYIRDGRLILAEGNLEIEVLSLAEVPLTLDGKVPFQVENVLAAAATAWRLGVPVPTISDGLRSFAGAPAETPGRFNILDANGATVIVDYAHNPSAVSALVAGLDAFPHPHRTLVFGGCDRREQDLLEMGRSAGDAFDEVVLYTDAGHAEPEANANLRGGLAEGARVRTILEEPTERAAIVRALADLRPGNLVVLGVEAIEESLEFVQNWLHAKRQSSRDPDPRTRT